MTHPFLLSLAGGILIGIAAVIHLLATRRVAGISGIAGGLFSQARQQMSERVTFLLGLVAGGGVVYAVNPSAVAVPDDRSLWMVCVAGVLVGIGTRFGNGCTSGHGVCGLSQGSTRSLAATASFMGAGVFTVAAVRWIGWVP